MTLGVGAGGGQSSTAAPGASAANPPTASSATTKKRTARRPAVKPSRTESVPPQSAPTGQPHSADAEAEQKARDQRLLEEQKRQSAQAAEVTNQQVERAQRQQESVQQEVRIQDAPGPAQTGVVPAAGPPVAPPNADQRIQDAPGPAQTLPPSVPAKPPLW